MKSFSNQNTVSTQSNSTISKKFANLIMAANTDMVTPVGLLFGANKVGVEIASLCGYDPYEGCGNIVELDEIHEIRVRNVWIGHGFWAGLGSIFTAPLAGSAITHWWVEIETRNGHWYCAQWESTKEKGHYLCLNRCNSLHDVTETGKWEANCKGQSKDITTRYQYKVPSYKTKTIGDLKQLMRKQGYYSLVSNNCQHFGARVYQWI